MSGYFGMVPRNLTFNAVRENSEVVMKFTQNICWLVVDQPLWKMMDFVSWEGWHPI